MYALGLRNTIATVIITIHYIGTTSFTKCSYIAFMYLIIISIILNHYIIKHVMEYLTFDTNGSVGGDWQSISLLTCTDHVHSVCSVILVKEICLQNINMYCTHTVGNYKKF